MRAALVTLLVLAAALPARGLEPAAVAGLAAEDADERIASIRALVATADPAAARVLQALADDRLETAGGRLLLVEGERVVDAASGAELSPPPGGREGVTLTNRVRRELAGA